MFLLASLFFCCNKFNVVRVALSAVANFLRTCSDLRISRLLFLFRIRFTHFSVALYAKRRPGLTGLAGLVCVAHAFRTLADFRNAGHVYAVTSQ